MLHHNKSARLKMLQPVRIWSDQCNISINMQKALFYITAHLSPGMRKQTFCICENKDADQLCYTDSPISLLPKSEISSP